MDKFSEEETCPPVWNCTPTYPTGQPRYRKNRPVRPQLDYTTSAVEVYKSETKVVIRRFLVHNLSFQNTIAALDAALAGVLPRLQPEQLDELRAVMLANNATVMEEMAQRASGCRQAPTAF